MSQILLRRGTKIQENVSRIESAIWVGDFFFFSLHFLTVVMHPAPNFPSHGTDTKKDVQTDRQTKLQHIRGKKINQKEVNDIVSQEETRQKQRNMQKITTTLNHPHC